MACAVDVSAARVVLQPAPARGTLAGKMQTTGAVGLANWLELFYSVEMGGSGSDDRLCAEAYPGNPSPWTFWQQMADSSRMARPWTIQGSGL